MPASESLGLLGVEFEPFHYFGLLLIGRIAKRKRVVFPFLPMVTMGTFHKRPQWVKPRMKYEVGMKLSVLIPELLNVQQAGRCEAGWTLVPLEQSQQLSPAAGMLQLQAKCEIKRSTQVLG